MALEQELETYEKHLPELLSDEGKFILIHQNDVVGLFAAYEDAIREGYNTFGLVPFLVKQIQAVEHVQYVTRNVEVCHT